jgi:rare lipoprotein A
MFRSSKPAGGRICLGSVLIVIFAACASDQSRPAEWSAAPPAYPADDEDQRRPRDADSAGPRQAVPQQQIELVGRYSERRPLRTYRGIASYYADKFVGRPTASGEKYDPKSFTAAHKTLPFGTIVRVVRADDQRVVYVRVNDRGPFGDRKRVIDLSRAAAEALHMLETGTVTVRAEVLEYPASR